MRTVLTAEKLWDGTRWIEQPFVSFDDGRIETIGSRLTDKLPAGEHVELPGAMLAPGFFDVHIHGASGHDVMEATPDALTKVGGMLGSHGTGAYLATTVTATVDATLRSLEGLSKLIARGPEEGSSVAWPVGIHLEGPFLSHAKRGVHPPALLQAADIGLFDKFWEAADGKIRLMTLAPELPGAVELARHATAKGVRISVGHSDATAAETRAVIAAGAVSATHTFNAMRALDHREPGILGVVLTDDNLFAELICDGIHSTPEMVKIWWRSKGLERAILVTDGMSATGMPDGEYQLGEITVQVANGRASFGDVLAGSVLTLDRALTNFVAFTGATVEQGLRLLTANPATMTGFDSGIGRLEVGGVANLVALDGSGRLKASFVRGRRAEQGIGR